MNLLYYWERFMTMPRLYPDFAYEYRFAALETKKEAKRQESLFIKRYVCRFGDRPPLNSALPNRYEGWEEALASVEQASGPLSATLTACKVVERPPKGKKARLDAEPV